MEHKEVVRIFKALGDENRLHILELIGSNQVCACKLLEHLKIGQPTLSHHMKILCESGIVEGTKEGKWIYYKMNMEKYMQVVSFLENNFKNNCQISIKCDKC